MSNAVTRAAHAKVNLTLRVLGRRADGYHALESVVMPLALHDDVEIRAGSGGGEGGVALSLSTISDGVDCSALGPPEANLCARAARAYLARLATGAPLNHAALSIRVVKRIPLGGGLGGGSADAAATLRALDELSGADALGEAALLDVAAEVGSDVPALLLGGPVLMEGRGERVARLDPVAFAPLPVLLANPGVPVHTPAAYAEYDRQRGIGTTGQRGLDMVGRHFRTVGDYGRILENDLEAPVFGLCPAVAETARILRAGGAEAVLMSGSGATVFALASSVAAAERLAGALPAGAWRCVTRLAPTSS